MLRRPGFALQRALRPQSSHGLAPGGVGRFAGGRGEARAPLAGWTVGATVDGGFEVEAVRRYVERGQTAYMLRHRASGTRALHVDAADTNNTVMVAFRTLPRSSDGVPHVLEHVALCGSRRFPVRDPFFHMLNRSLNSYMNAYTASDHTAYPFSTEHAHDRDNLLRVYLDAAFHPLLRRVDFLQEGWRFEPSLSSLPSSNSSSSTTNSTAASPSKLEYHGVVFNEMKGAMSDVHSLAAQWTAEELYPRSVYAVNSGGDPESIPSLTYAKLRSFHRTHYHPANALLYTYGDLPPGPVLQRYAEDVIAAAGKVEDAPSVPMVPLPKRFARTRRAVRGFQADPRADPARPCRFSMSWATADVTDAMEMAALGLLSHLLVEGPNAPLYKLLEEDFGLDLAGSGLDSYGRVATFSVGLSGVRNCDLPRLEARVMALLADVVRDGFEKERVDALLHQYELSLSVVTPAIGRSLGSSAVAAWIHGADPLEHLDVDSHLAALRAALDKDAAGFFRNLMERHLLRNNHRLTLRMVPDADVAARAAAAERARARAASGRMSPAALAAVERDVAELRRTQEQPQDPSCLPTVLVSDIPLHPPGAVPLDEIGVAGCPSHTAAFMQRDTQGVVHVKAWIPLPRDLTADELAVLPHMATCWSGLGAGGRDFREQAQRMDQTIGELRLSPRVAAHPTDPARFAPFLALGTHFLRRRGDAAAALIADVWNAPDFDDTARIQTLLQMELAGFQDEIVQAGHTYAMRRASARVSPALAMMDDWFGLGQQSVLERLLRDIDSAPSLFRSLLAKLRRQPVRFCVVADHADAWGAGLSSLLGAIDAAPLAGGEAAREPHFWTVADAQTPLPAADAPAARVPIAAAVHYHARCLPGVPYQNADLAPLQVAATLVGVDYLHPRVREQGGAYGSGCEASANAITYYSYRDPQQTATQDVFRGAGAWLQDGAVNDAAVNKALVRLFSDVGKPRAPSTQADAEFDLGMTLDVRVEHRRRLLAVTPRDVLRVAGTYLRGDLPASAVVLEGNGK